MENKVRWWSSFKVQMGIVVVAVVLTWGVPLLVRYAGKATNPRLAFLAVLEGYGWWVLLAAPFLLLLLAWWGGWRIRREQNQLHQKFQTEGVTYLLLPRPDAPRAPAERVSLWQRLSHALPVREHLSFELTGNDTGQVFSIRASSPGVVRGLITQLMTEYPGVEVREVERANDDPLLTTDQYVTVWQEVYPARRDQPLVIATPDPQLGTLGEVALLPSGVQAGVQVLIRPDFHTRGRLMRAAAYATSKKPDTGTYALRPSGAEKRDTSYLDERAQLHFVEGQVIVWAAAPYEGMAWQVVHSLTDTLRAQYQPHNPLQIGKKGTGSRYGREMAAFAGRGWSTLELGTLAHLVGGETAALAPRLLRARGRPLPAPPLCAIARRARVARFLADARRQKHMATVQGAGEEAQLVVSTVADELLVVLEPWEDEVDDDVLDVEPDDLTDSDVTVAITVAD